MDERLPKLLKFESPDDFMKREAWRDDVDVRTTPPVKILGGYDFPKALHLRCGLASCRTMHGLGFVVLLADDSETHVGRYCGRRHVEGAVWEELYGQFQIQRRAETQIDVVERLYEQRQEVLGRAYDLLARAEKAQNAVTGIQVELVRDKAIDRAWANVVRAQGQLTYYRDATERERQLDPKARFIPVSLGRLEGFSIGSGWAVRENLRRKVIDHLEGLDAKKIMSLKGKELSRYAKFIDETRGALRQAAYYLGDAERYLRPGNWQAFERFCRESGVRFGPDAENIFARIGEAALKDDRSWAEPR